MGTETKKEPNQKKSAEELLKIENEKHKIKVKKLKQKIKQDKNNISKSDYEKLKNDYEKLKRFEKYNKDFYFMLCEYLKNDLINILINNGFDGVLHLEYIESVLEKNLQYIGTKKES
jgi:hypothetical protein